jgi:hypothetical protein
MRQRFIDRYAEAVYSCCNGARYLLQRPDVVKQIEKNTRAFLRREKIKLTRKQFENLLEVMHPKLVKIYWPVSGAISTMRQYGVLGLLKKVVKRIRRGDV